MAREYVPSCKYEDVFTGRKYSPEHPIPKIMQNLRKQREGTATPGMMRNLDLNSGPSSSSQPEDHHVDLLRETHQRPQTGRTYRRSRATRFEQNVDLPDGTYHRSCPKTMATVAMVVQRRLISKEYKVGSKRLLYDRTSDGYEWLHSGWLCEERIMKTGRIYRYYYNPKGDVYDSKLGAIGAMSRPE